MKFLEVSEDSPNKISTKISKTVTRKSTRQFDFSSFTFYAVATSSEAIHSWVLSGV